MLTANEITQGNLKYPQNRRPLITGGKLKRQQPAADGDKRRKIRIGYHLLPKIKNGMIKTKTKKGQYDKNLKTPSLTGGI